jgi:hypothetical protein
LLVFDDCDMQIAKPTAERLNHPIYELTRDYSPHGELTAKMSTIDVLQVSVQQDGPSAKVGNMDFYWVALSNLNCINVQGKSRRTAPHKTTINPESPSRGLSVSLCC